MFKKRDLKDGLGDWSKDQTSEKSEELERFDPEFQCLVSQAPAYQVKTQPGVNWTRYKLNPKLTEPCLIVNWTKIELKL